MKKTFGFFLLLFILMLCSCGDEGDLIDASQNGVLPENTGKDNSVALQRLIDKASLSGKVIFIPAGEYEFAANGNQTIGSHCIKMRSGVSILGEGEATVLKPVGESLYGLDMFYFNDYLDKGEAVYLENCRFEDFMIDGSGTSCQVYTSAGKGFMFNLFKNCHFENITVKHTDATGFGVDCPIDCSITNCIAIGCGKGASEESSGASGFGIGFGYAEEESILISGCRAEGNKKFGFFFEHQGRFNGELYTKAPTEGFTVEGCIAEGNLFGFGGIGAMNAHYEDCFASASRRYGFYFENSFSSGAKSCRSENDGVSSFVFCQKKEGEGQNYLTGCEGYDLLLEGEHIDRLTPVIEGCRFDNDK